MKYDDSDSNPYGLMAAISRNEDFPPGDSGLLINSMKLSYNDHVFMPNSNFNLQRRLDQLIVENAVQTTVVAERTSRMEKRKGCHLTPPSRPTRGPSQRPSSIGRSTSEVLTNETALQVDSPSVFSKFLIIFILT